MLLMIDNYDSFTFNLVQYFCELGEEVKVVRNDAITLDEIAALKPDRLVLSPGPCSPAEAGICVPALQRFTGQLPILGVCLGHQSIGAALGGKVVRAQEQMHGKTSVITTDQKGVYAGLPGHFTVIRYVHHARRRDHGRAPHRPANGRELRAAGRRAVPPRVHPDRARPRHAGQLPEDVRRLPCPN